MLNIKTQKTLWRVIFLEKLKKSIKTFILLKKAPISLMMARTLIYLTLLNYIYLHFNL
jgi:hypothetical protein